jgi:hypothetical protein
MASYRVSGFVFASAVAFPDLAPIVGARAETTLVLTRQPIAPARPRWYHRWRLPRGTEWLRFARVGPHYLLRFPRLADFLVSPDAALVRCRPCTGTPIGTLRHLFLNQVLPLVMGQRGRLVVHASAVVTPRGAVAFLGGSGRGKSTLAASLWADGFPLVTDDCLCLEDRRGRLVAVPSHPAIRLWPSTLRRLAIDAVAPRRSAHYTDKVRIPADDRRRAFVRRPVRVAGVYVLSSARGRAAVRIEPLSARDALVELIAHLYRLDVGGRETLRRDFNRLADIARRLPVCRLHVPRGLARLAEVKDAVIRGERELRTED